MGSILSGFLTPAPGGSWTLILRVILAGLCGGAIGFERTKRLKEAGIRTHCIIAIAACLFMILSKYGFADLENATGAYYPGTKGADPARIAALSSSVVRVIADDKVGVGVTAFDGHTFITDYALVAEASTIKIITPMQSLSLKRSSCLVAADPALGVAICKYPDWLEGMIPMPTACWMWPKTMGMRVLPI